MRQDAQAVEPQLDLADLIDIEYQLQLDRSLPVEELYARDSAIARKIGEEELEGRRLYLRWLEELRAGGEAGLGERIEQARGLLSALLATLGALLGASAVAGWLAFDAGLPVNVTNFWPLLVGSQAVLFALWLVSIAPTPWLKLLPMWAGLQTLLRAAGTALPRAAAGLLGRLGAFHGADPGRRRAEAYSAQLGELRKLDWLYGDLRFWLLSQHTQVFGLAFNVGAIAAFTAIPYIDDPAFGWRSRLLDAESLYNTTQAIALPWSWAIEGAAPTLEQIEATRYSSVATRFERELSRTATDATSWAAWWPFVLASLFCYGLFPRMVSACVSTLKVRRALAGVTLDHADFDRLRSRLKRPDVDTRARAAEFPGPTGTKPVAPAFTPEAMADGPSHLLRWSGVTLSDERLAAQVADRFGAPTGPIQVVGALVGDGDDAAFERIASDSPATPVILVVEAWEPPVGDYLDFIADLRANSGPTRPILVLLFERDSRGDALPASARQFELWQNATGSLADPYLRVDSLMGGPTR